MPDAGYYHKKRGQEQDGEIVKAHYSFLEHSGFPLANHFVYYADNHQADADNTVCSGGFFWYEGSEYKQNYRAQEKIGGEIVSYFGNIETSDFLPVAAEDPQQYSRCCNHAYLFNPEHTRAAIHPEKVQEIHIRIAAKHN